MDICASSLNHQIHLQNPSLLNYHHQHLVNSKIQCPRICLQTTQQWQILRFSGSSVHQQQRVMAIISATSKNRLIFLVSSKSALYLGDLCYVIGKTRDAFVREEAFPTPSYVFDIFGCYYQSSSFHNCSKFLSLFLL